MTSDSGNFVEQHNGGEWLERLHSTYGIRARNHIKQIRILGLVQAVKNLNRTGRIETVSKLFCRISAIANKT